MKTYKKAETQVRPGFLGWLEADGGFSVLVADKVCGVQSGVLPGTTEVVVTIHASGSNGILVGGGLAMNQANVLIDMIEKVLSAKTTAESKTKTLNLNHLLKRVLDNVPAESQLVSDIQVPKLVTN